MNRNLSTGLPGRTAEAAVAMGSCITSTVQQALALRHAQRAHQMVSPENAKSSSDDDEQQMQLTKKWRLKLQIWDTSMDEDVALFLQEFNASDIFMGVLAKSKCPRLREICVGISGNMACFHIQGKKKEKAKVKLLSKSFFLFGKDSPPWPEPCLMSSPNCRYLKSSTFFLSASGREKGDTSGF